MKSYYRVMLGKKNLHAEECIAGNFIGADFGIEEDLTNRLPDEWRAFNKVFLPIWIAAHPGASKITGGLFCGYTWTVAKGIQRGDLVLCPDGQGTVHVAEVIGDYQYVQDGVLPHRRAVRWLDATIDRSAMSDGLKGCTGMVANISGYREEIERFVSGAATATMISKDATVEDPIAFAMEKHLEDFLVQNWTQTDLGKEYDIFEQDGEKVGQQYQTDTGPLDILAIRKDKRELLVVELKRGRASDVVVGQVLRYMGYAAQELAENGQSVRGVIIALEDDQRLRRALAVTPNVSFLRYQVDFKLLRAQ